MGEAIRESSVGTRLGTSSKLGMFFVNREKGLFLSVYVDDIKLAGKKQNIEPTWTMFMKDVDLGEPTSFLDHVHLGCTQRDCQLSKDIVDKYRRIFESRISAGAEEKYRLKPQGNVMQKQYLLGPMTWKVMQRNAWKDSANMRIKQLNNFVRSRHHAWMTINFLKEEIGSVREFSTVCSQTGMTYFYLARFVRLDILWSVNKLARAITQWTKACANVWRV